MGRFEPSADQLRCSLASTAGPSRSSVQAKLDQDRQGPLTLALHSRLSSARHKAQRETTASNCKPHRITENELKKNLK